MALQSSSNDVNQQMRGLQPLIPVHDAILPYEYLNVKWAIPNIGDNLETHNLSMSRIFDKINEHLQAFSLMRDCFAYNPPTVGCVKAHHNMFVRLNNIIDTVTKMDNQERLEAPHVTHERRQFKIYPVRYFDMKNDYTKRWVELGLQGLSNIAQLSENVWANDFSEASAREMKKLFREAYRLMCVELFQVPITEAAKVFDDAEPYYLQQAQFDTYNTDHIPEIEWIRQPALGAFLTEDEMRAIANPSVTVGEGVPENDPDDQQRELQRAAEEGHLLGDVGNVNTGNIVH